MSEPKKISVSNGNEYNRKEIIMNLDEAIKRAKEVASEQKRRSGFARQAIMNAINFPPALKGK